MRTSLRVLVSTAIGAALLLSLGVGATLAKPSDKPAPPKPTVEVIDLAESWCFDDVVALYCNVQTGTLTIKTWPDGSSASTVDMVTKTVVTQDGAFVARSTITVNDRTAFDADGSYSTDQRERTVWTDGTETCVTTSHFRSVDFEVKIDTQETRCR